MIPYHMCIITIKIITQTMIYKSNKIIYSIAIGQSNQAMRELKIETFATLQTWKYNWKTLMID